MAEQKIKVVVADEHPFMRVAMERELSQRPLFEVIGSSDDLTSDALSSMTSSLDSGVYLIGCATLTPAVIGQLDRLAAKRPECGIAIICGSVESGTAATIQHLSVAARAGMGLMFRDSLRTGDDVEQMLISVAGGRVVLDREAMSEIVSPQQNAGASDRLSALTSRELEVLKLMAQGLNNAGIASALNVRHNTANRHIYNIYQKLKGRPEGVQPRAYATSLLRNLSA